jgi:hypothetical protein
LASACQRRAHKAQHQPDRQEYKEKAEQLSHIRRSVKAG